MFSETVDTVIVRARASRQKRLNDISNAVNAALNQLAAKDWFVRNTIEDQIVLSGTNNTSYIYPKPARYWALHTVKYEPGRVYPKLIPPSREEVKFAYRWYENGESIIFDNLQGFATIGLFLSLRPPFFQYFDTALRPAIYNRFTDTFSYPLGATSAADQLSARERVSHWLLQHWNELVIETALSILWTDQSHPQARATFARAEKYLTTMMTTEQIIVPENG